MNGAWALLLLLLAFGACAVGLRALDRWHDRRAWRNADRFAREYMRERSRTTSVTRCRPGERSKTES